MDSIPQATPDQERAAFLHTNRAIVQDLAGRLGRLPSWAEVIEAVDEIDSYYRAVFDAALRRAGAIR